MDRQVRLTIMLSAITVLGASGVVGAAWQVVYETDFSTDPGWITDDPAKLRWNPPPIGTYCGTQVNVEGTVAYHPVPGFNPNMSWRLDFDSVINSADWSAGRDVGLFDSQIDMRSGVVTDQSIADQGHGTALFEHGHGYSRYSPPWSAGVWYHHRIEYDADTSRLSVTVSENAVLRWSFDVPVAPFPADMNNVGVSRRHTKGASSGLNPLASVDYCLDNLVLMQIPEPGAFVLLLGGISGVVLRRKRC